MARRIPLGFSSWADYNRHRIEEGVKRGLSPSAALGHPKRGEPTASDLRQVKKSPDTAPLDVLRRAALANSRAQVRDRLPITLPHGQIVSFDEQEVRDRIGRIDDRDTLLKMSTITSDEWVELATHQLPNNAFYYH